MKSLNKNVIIILSFLILLAGCSLNSTEKQKMIDYLSKSEAYKEYRDENDRTFYVLNVDGDFYSDIAHYYNNEASYAYYAIDKDTLKYSFEDKNYYSSSLGNSVVHVEFEYNPKTNISKGSYVLNTYSKPGNMATVHKEYSYLYDYNTGTSECAYKSSSFSQAEECIISGDSYGEKFLALKESFLTLLESSGVSEKKFYDELSK